MWEAPGGWIPTSVLVCSPAYLPAGTTAFASLAPMAVGSWGMDSNLLVPEPGEAQAR